MNPEIAKHWNKALDYFNAAKDSFKNGGSDSDIKKQLWMSIAEAQFMTRELKTGSDEKLISSGIALDVMAKFQQLTVLQAFDKTLKVLRDCHNLVPTVYNLPMPNGLG